VRARLRDRRGPAAPDRAGHRHGAVPPRRRGPARRAARPGAGPALRRHRRRAPPGPLGDLPRGHRGPRDRGGGAPGRAHPGRQGLRGAHRRRAPSGDHRRRRPLQRPQPDPAREGHPLAGGRAADRRGRCPGRPARRHPVLADLHPGRRGAAADGRRPRRAGDPHAPLRPRPRRRLGAAAQPHARPAAEGERGGVRGALRPRRGRRPRRRLVRRVLPAVGPARRRHRRRRRPRAAGGGHHGAAAQRPARVRPRGGRPGRGARAPRRQRPALRGRRDGHRPLRHLRALAGPRVALHRGPPAADHGAPRRAVGADQRARRPARRGLGGATPPDHRHRPPARGAVLPLHRRPRRAARPVAGHGSRAAVRRGAARRRLRRRVHRRAAPDDRPDGGGRRRGDARGAPARGPGRGAAEHRRAGGPAHAVRRPRDRAPLAARGGRTARRRGRRAGGRGRGVRQRGRARLRTGGWHADGADGARRSDGGDERAGQRTVAPRPRGGPRPGHLPDPGVQRPHGRDRRGGWHDGHLPPAPDGGAAV
ncbi:MAG: Serine phosphatase RsbU, regulator of sigma subunit, partial [uncultured Actinomycetospora sp.]